MADGVQRVGVDEVQWSGVLAWTRLFRTFRMAIQPSRLLLALLFVILCFLGGKVLDFMWGPSVYTGEIARYNLSAGQDFDTWRNLQGEQIATSLSRHLRGKGLELSEDDTDALVNSKQRFTKTQSIINEYYNVQQDRLTKTSQSVEDDLAKQLSQTQEELKAGVLTKESADKKIERIEQNRTDTRKAQAGQRDRIEERRAEELMMLRQLQPRGVFEASSTYVLGAFDRGVLGAVSLNFGLGDLLRANTGNSASVAGALKDVFITLPGWLYQTHFWFMLVYLVLAMALWSILGGAICRLAALDATTDKLGNTAAALEFAGRRFVWFFLTPLFPFIACGLLSLVLMLAGLVFFNAQEIWLLDVAGGALFVVAIVVGLIIAIILMLTAGGAHLFYPALAVEGTDAFDALSRSFGYLIARPWRWLFYTLVSMVYFAVTYLFVGMVLFLSLSITQSVIRLAVFREAGPEGSGSVNRFDAMLPAPKLGHLVYEVEWSLLDTPGKIAAALIWVWVFVTVCALAAFAISFYANVHTWIYLLLRKSVDGTGYDEVFVTQPAVINLQSTNNEQVQAQASAHAVGDKVEPAAVSQTAAPETQSSPVQEDNASDDGDKPKGKRKGKAKNDDDNDQSND